MAGAEAPLEPRADSGPTPMNHPGEELVIVLEGRMAFDVDGERYELGAGDSIHFRTRPPALVAQPDRRAGAGDLARASEPPEPPCASSSPSGATP